MKRVITITTDFGGRDPYVPQMKGVILSINPLVTIVDGTHEIPPQDIFGAALFLKGFCGYFPEGSIHIVVVDPGVGTERRGLLVRADDIFLLGPDNGVLSFEIERANRGGGVIEIYELVERRFFLPNISTTFHGRDIFAPCAAHLSKGAKPSEFGPPVKDPVIINLPIPEKTADGVIGEVIHIDRFGNCMMNIEREDIRGIYEKGRFCLEIKGEVIEGPSPTYQAVRPGSPLLLWGSAGFLEVSINGGSAEKKFEIKRGDRFLIRGVDG